MITKTRYLILALVLLSLTVTTASAAVMVSEQNDYFATHDVEVSFDNAQGRAVFALQAKMTDELMRQAGIVGTAVGVDSEGVPALVIYADLSEPGAEQTIRKLPDRVGTVNLRVENSGKIYAGGPPSSKVLGTGHTDYQTPPISLGTSGGRKDDFGGKSCCSGTLGALVQDQFTSQYVLSNFHVLEKHGFDAKPIIQPGLGDLTPYHCALDGDPPTSIASLVPKSALPDHNVDCAVASVRHDGQGLPFVRSDGWILDIGTLSTKTRKLHTGGARVKKSGRTTGLTFSKIYEINATCKVFYPFACNGSNGDNKIFTGQIAIVNPGGFEFSDEGDSGAVVVEDRDPNPRAIGLLFGSNEIRKSFANPIRDVLEFLDMKMVGVPTDDPD
jgi:hypothetical protein